MSHTQEQAGPGIKSTEVESDEAAYLEAESIIKSLTKNERLVYAALKNQSAPLKAYDLLDILKTKGVRAPMTVYRALEGLEEKGLVHKLEALNAFVLCNHDAPHQVQTFFVCNKCTHVTEIHAGGTTEVPSVESNIISYVAASGFKLDEARLEIKGICPNCL